MRGRRWKAAVVLSFLLLPGPIPAEEAAFLDRFGLEASLRARFEAWNWFEAQSGDNEYGFGATTLRAGIRYLHGPLASFVEFQNTSLVGLPDDATAPAPEGALGLGAVYFAHNREQDDTGFFLKQGFLTINAEPLGLRGLSLTGGRFEFSDGLEVLTGDATLDWLKKLRVSQRLLGPFGWSHVGRAYDGFKLVYDTPAANLTMMTTHPTQGGFDLNGMDEMDRIDLLYGALTVKRSERLPFGEGRLFYLYYGDGRNVTKVDNRPPGPRAADRQDISLSTFGAHFIAARDMGPGKGDLLLWGAWQDGEWGVLEHGAWAWAAELGYRFTGVAWSPWLRAGAFRGSGDDDPADRDHDTFFQVLPTARLYSFSTFYNLMNNQDYFVQMILKPHAQLLWRTDLRFVRLTEGRDLWYQGAGPTLGKRIFGYTGRPGFGETDLMTLVETTLSYDITSSLNLNLYYMHSFGGRLVSRIFENHDADFGYVELQFTL